jgi:hypothetical protein
MSTPKASKPATARDTRKPASNVEQLGSELAEQNSLIDKRAQRLRKLFAFEIATAAVVAELAFTVEASR